jgi:hypothetical protein
MPKCEVRVGIAADVEAVGVAELFGVAVGRADDGEHHPSFGDDLTGELDVAAGGADRHLDRRAVAQHLLDGRGDEVGGRQEAGQLARVLDQAEDCVVDEVAGGLGARNEEQLDKRTISPNVSVAPSTSARTSWVSRSSRGAARRPDTSCSR